MLVPTASQVNSLASIFCTNEMNSSSLKFLDLSHNDFSGLIPVGLGRCSKLEIFRAGFNQQTGPIPSDIFSAVALQEISLPQNTLSGTIGNGIIHLTNLRVLELHSNVLSGPIPHDMNKLTKLEEILLHINNLNGTLPPSLMNCVNLVTLNLRINSLVGDLSAFNFSRFFQLTKLDLGNNYFTGNLPPSLFACKSLTAIRLAGNHLEGQISPDILELKSLSFLSVSNNNLKNLTGAIKILTGLKNLTTLVLSRNFVADAIPYDDYVIDTDGFQKLRILGLGNCSITGNFPSWLVKLKKLEVVDLSFNQITGSIPSWLGTLPQLFYLDLADNLITGKFPKELAGLPALTSKQENDGLQWIYLELPLFILPTNATLQQYNRLLNLPPAIFLENNQLVGNIPIEIGQLKCLHVLDLSNNQISGNIPHQISNLTDLEKLDLSRNNLSGEIPKEMAKLTFLSYLDLSFNNLEGQVPTGGVFQTLSPASFQGNRLHFGGLPVLQPPPPLNILKRKKHHSLKFTIIVMSVSMFFLMLFTFISLVWLRKSKRKPSSTLSTVEHLPKVSYRQLHQATDGFSPNNLIGSGGFGCVYKGILGPEEREVAVKVLNLKMKGASESFFAECNALKKIRHRNLVKILTCCSSIDYSDNEFKALVFEFMENGSLEQWLHPQTEGKNDTRRLNLLQSLNIAIEVASALYYLHDLGEQPVVHCDLKPGNILLDNDMTAHVSDFGLARLIFATSDISRNQITTLEIKGSIGYAAPEYGMGGEASTRGDVYSFGILLLEMFTGKRPTDDMFKDGLNLHMYAKLALQQNYMRNTDPNLLQTEVEHVKVDDIEIELNLNQISADVQKCLFSVFKIGIACSMESPKERINMGDVTRQLNLVRNSFLGVEDMEKE
ncbi:Receptor kinase [Quillaja saponaria]|uniref:non-specific serine/threonine protein kinase n=1 Tax=Quillaja saponaria TaxID=32244 RepID=A0AAD7LL79_QUISA|nr:Receptor kinase [Quillaja saponaria]